MFNVGDGLCIKTLKVNKTKCENACTKEIFAADYAYELVEKGIPFREAYKLAVKEIGNIKVPDLKKALKKRCHLGGSGNFGLEELQNKIKLIKKT